MIDTMGPTSASASNAAVNSTFVSSKLKGSFKQRFAHRRTGIPTAASAGGRRGRHRERPVTVGTDLKLTSNEIHMAHELGHISALPQNVLDVSAVPAAYNFSFCGGGFLGVYHIGVAKALQEAGLADKVRIAGASCGVIVATALLAGCDMDQVCRDLVRVAQDVRNSRLHLRIFKTLSTIFEAWDKYIDDAKFEECKHIFNTRLEIAVTSVTGQALRIKHFKTRADLRKATMASCCIPFVMGFVSQRHNGRWLVDGGFTDNQPVFDEPTVSVSPLAASKADRQCA